jgi:hypothetical protein
MDAAEFSELCAWMTEAGLAGRSENDQPLLVSSAFALAIGEARSRLVSVGRYALRGVGRPQDLFTLEEINR